MIQNNQETQEINNINNLDTKDIPSRLVIKNIPHSLSDNQIKDILKKNFEDRIKDDILICKLEKKYSLKKRNKICFITVDNLKTRNEVYEFFSTFELIDPKGIKQKLTVNDCLYQSKIKAENDPIENTIDSCEHFLKFKEYFSKEKLVEFKNEENKFCDNLYEGISNNSNSESKNSLSSLSNNSPMKMIIIKKNDIPNLNSSKEESNSNSNNYSYNTYNDNQIEIIDDNRNNNNNYYNKGYGKYRNNNCYYDNKGKGKFKDNNGYYNNRKSNNYYDNDGYGDNYHFNGKGYYNNYNKGYKKGGY